MLTLNQIVRRIQTISLSHAQVNNFHHGVIGDSLNDKKTRYPSFFLQDSGGTIDIIGKTRTVNYTVALLDMVNVSEDAKTNELDVQSDQLSIAEDLVAMMDHSDYTDWKVSNVNFTLVAEELEDMLAGVRVDLSIVVPYIKDMCRVPMSDAEAFALQYGWFEENPYMEIQDAEFLFTKELAPGVTGYSMDFEASGKYLAVKEPSDEGAKSTWANTNFNYGVFPDQVFRDPVIISGSRYYVSRKPVELSNTIITFNV